MYMIVLALSKLIVIVLQNIPFLLIFSMCDFGSEFDKLKTLLLTTFNRLKSPEIINFSKILLSQKNNYFFRIDINYMINQVSKSDSL